MIAVAAKNAARVAHPQQAILMTMTLAKDCVSAQEMPEPQVQMCVGAGLPLGLWRKALRGGTQTDREEHRSCARTR